jgi:hypothetical protein
MAPRTTRASATSNKEIADVVAAAVAAAAARAAESVAAAAATAAVATATAAATAAAATASTAAATATAAVAAADAAAAATAASSKDAERQFAEMKAQNAALDERIGLLEGEVKEGNKNIAEILVLVQAGRLGGKFITWVGGLLVAATAVLAYLRMR